MTGDVRLRCEPGRCTVVGRRSDVGLYDYGLATYDAADTLPPRGRGRLRPPVGPRGADVGQPPGAAAEYGALGRRRPDDPLAGAARRRGGRRPDGLHRQPAVRRPAGGRRRRRLQGPRAGPAAGRAADRRGGRRPARGPRPVGEELASGTFRFGPGDEDVHTAVERRVTELAGPAGAKLHTGRSRNDQVATDLRLWTKRELVARRPAGWSPCSGCCWTGPSGPSTEGVYLPGYTHLQRAQPVLLAHHLLAHALGPGPRRRPPARHPPPPRRVAPGRRRPGRLVAAPRPRRHRPRPGLRRPPSRTPSTPSATATSWPRPSSTWPCWASTCPASARRWCCGRAPSSGSCAWPTSGPPAARCCPRRRTPTWPSWPGARRAGSSAT